MNESEIRSTANSAPHLVYEFSGSAYEIGRQHGETLREAIHAEHGPAMDRFANAFDGSRQKALRYHRDKFFPLFADRVPRAIEEVKGIAAGAGLTFDEAFFGATRDGARPDGPKKEESEGCTSFSAGGDSTVAAGVFMGQTKDTNAPLSRYRITRYRYDDGDAALILNYPGWLAHTGITSHGLVNTGNSLVAKEAEGETMPFVLVKRLAMEKKSLQEVLKAIDGLVFHNACLLVGSDTGEAVCLEFVNGKVARHDISHRTYGHANTILDADLKQYEIPGYASSQTRQKNIDRLLQENSGSLDAEKLKEICQSHADHPHGICRHPSPEDRSITTAAIVADLKGRKAHICIGHPCSGNFKEYAL